MQMFLHMSEKTANFSFVWEMPRRPAREWRHALNVIGDSLCLALNKNVPCFCPYHFICKWLWPLIISIAMIAFHRWRRIENIIAFQSKPFTVGWGGCHGGVNIHECLPTLCIWNKIIAVWLRKCMVINL